MFPTNERPALTVPSEHTSPTKGHPVGAAAEEEDEPTDEAELAADVEAAPVALLDSAPRLEAADEPLSMDVPTEVAPFEDPPEVELPVVAELPVELLEDAALETFGAEKGPWLLLDPPAMLPDALPDTCAAHLPSVQDCDAAQSAGPLQGRKHWSPSRCSPSLHFTHAI